MPKVTAICPTANRQKWIPLAVDCFLAQTFTDSELLIVDDGTEPCMTPELQASLIDRVRYVRLAPWPEAKPHRPYRYTGMKRNICCEEARGEVIVHWDDDDWCAPNRIESQLAFMNQTGNPRGVGTGTPQVSGTVSAGSKTLTTKGWTHGISGILKAGDYIQVGTGSQQRLYKLLTDANSDGSGDATLDIFPRLREGVSDGQSITVTSAQGTFRLDNNTPSWDVDEAQVYGIQFTCTEAI